MFAMLAIVFMDERLLYRYLHKDIGGGYRRKWFVLPEKLRNGALCRLHDDKVWPFECFSHLRFVPKEDFGSS